MLMCTYHRERELVRRWNEEKAEAERAGPKEDPRKQELGS